MGAGPDLPRETAPPILIYQSRLFVDVLPRETYAMAEGGHAELRWTEAVPDERPQPGYWDKSLFVMREAMLRDNNVAAAIFIGGMEGIRAEYDLFRDFYPTRPRYPLRQPGGEAALLPEQPSSTDLLSELRTSSIYPALLHRIAEDIAKSP